MTQPSDCTDMTQLRALIDRIDARLVALLAERTACIDRAAQIKSDVGLPARIEARIEEVVAKVRAEAAGRDLDPDLVEGIWRPLMEWSIAREERVLGRDHGMDEQR